MTTSGWATFWLIVGIVSILLTIISSGAAWIHRKFGHKNVLSRMLPEWIRDLELFTVLSGIVGLLSFVGSAYCASEVEAQIQDKLKPRDISASQAQNLIGYLKKIPGRGTINIRASILDAEAMNFAKRIEEVLTNSGFEVVYARGWTDDSSMIVGPPGIHIVVRNPKDAPRWVVPLQRSFRSSGIDLLGLTTSDPRFESNTVVIAVGQR